MQAMRGIGMILIMGFSAPAAAADVPAAVRNKTITISFTATGTAKSPDGKVHNFATSVSRLIYVSSAGRLFMRHNIAASSGRASRGGDFGPGDTRQGSFGFQGKRLVGVIPYANGARQITATFDAGFSSCTVSVIEGHSGGTIRRTGPDGVMREITSGSTSSANCSIQSGNAFGDR